MNGVERGDELRIKRKSVSLNELEWIIRLGHDINPNNGKTCPAIANAGATSAAEKIKAVSAFLRSSFSFPLSHFELSIPFGTDESPQEIATYQSPSAISPKP